MAHMPHGGVYLAPGRVLIIMIRQFNIIVDYAHVAPHMPCLSMTYRATEGAAPRLHRCWTGERRSNPHSWPTYMTAIPA